MDATANGRQAGPGEVGVEMPKVVTPESGTMSGPLVPVSARLGSAILRRADAVRVGLRAACLATSVLSLALMVSSEQSGTLSLYGLQLPLYSKWSFSESLEFLVGVSAAVAAHSLLQLLLAGAKMVKRLPVVTSSNHAWIIFAGDQAFAYAMMSAGSAAAGVTNLNRTGVHHSPLPDFCKPLQRFCNRMAVSITFAFISWLLLATSALFDVLWLSKY
uniref:CASP-like protein n=1 Tax=Anthurium amnicola TaxID=1678845 RepID=A0A1D1Z6J8_9ARAE